MNNVFVLSTGRAGSVTFANACQWITNFTTAHESKISDVSGDRIRYPDKHIEVDHRLSFFKGLIHANYDPASTYWVYLKRNHLAVEYSWVRRTHIKGSMINTWPHAAFFRPDTSNTLLMAQHYVRSTMADLQFFIDNVRHGSVINIEDPRDDFLDFWDAIGAQGDKLRALATLEERYNVSRR